MMNLIEKIERCAKNPVFTYLQQIIFNCIPSLNYETYLLGKKINASEYVTKGNAKKIAFEIKKVDLAKYYQVDKKTLNKWIKAFCPENFYNQWIHKGKKLVTEEDFHILKDHLGFSLEYVHLPKNLISKFTNNKKAAIRILMEDTSVQIMDINTYKSINKFPPKIYDKLLQIIDKEL